MKRIKKERGVNVSVSKEAHKKMIEESLKAVPQKTLREVVNIKYNLPEHV